MSGPFAASRRSLVGGLPFRIIRRGTRRTLKLKQSAQRQSYPRMSFAYYRPSGEVEDATPATATDIVRRRANGLCKSAEPVLRIQSRVPVWVRDMHRGLFTRPANVTPGFGVAAVLRSGCFLSL